MSPKAEREIPIRKLVNDSSDAVQRKVKFLSEKLSEFRVNDHMIKQVITWQLAKKRSGSHKTKSISELAYTGKKPHAQKGTGRSRKGSLRAPQMRGGCVVHGPVVRKYGVNAPSKKIRSAAVLHALVDKLIHNKIVLVDSFQLEQISSKGICYSLTSMGIEGSSFICIDAPSKEFELSCRNLPFVKVVCDSGINVYDIVRYDYFLCSEDFIKRIMINFI